MGKKLCFFLACLFMSTSLAIAQTKQVTGSVVDSDTGEPIVGAAVKVKGTTLGILTDAEGKFVLKNLPANAKTLIVSCMGMQTEEIPVKGSVTVALSSSTSAMDEVMVIAYGTQQKSSFTGSAAIVGADEIAKVQVTNAADALKGKAAGVQIVSGSQPGTTPTIRIRGFNSLGVGSQSPLLVVDGSPFGGSWNDINPVDVETMTVLKDAASTALYGARGGNGVILITTKSGKRHKDASITFDAKWGVNMKGSRDYDLVDDPRGYYETYHRSLSNYALNTLGKNAVDAYKFANDNLINTDGGFGLGYNVYNVPAGEAMIGTNGKLNPNATLGNVVTGRDGNQYLLTPDNWDKEIYHKGLRQQYTLSASGASDKGGYYISTDYLKHEGLTYNSDYERFSARLRADYMLKKWLRFTGNVSYSHESSNSIDDSEEMGSGNIFALHNIAPIYPVFMRDAQGNILIHQASGIKAYDYADATSGLGMTRPYMSQSNPISDILVNTNGAEGNTFMGTGTFDVYLTKNLTFTSLNNVYLTESRSTNVTNPYFGQYKTENGTVAKEHDRWFNLNFQQRLNYHNTFGAHDVEVTAAHEYYRARTYALSGTKNNMFSQENKELNGAVILRSTGSSMGEYNTESWLARAMYNYDARYFAQASVLRQASSAFHPDHRWGTFWSASLGWMLSKEDFFKAKWVDELKVKASFGQNGNDGGLNGYFYTNRYGISNSNNSVSLTPSTLGKNENLSWETSTKFNTGVDFSLFKGRLYGTFEYYNNHTSGLVSSVPYSPSFGYASYYDNIGNMRNHGVELDLHGVVMRNKDFEWNVFANVTSNSNRITELAESSKKTYIFSYDPKKNEITDVTQGYTSGSWFYGEGHSRYCYYTKMFAGVYNQDTYKKTYAPGTPEDQMVYDQSKAGLAMYYKNKLATDPTTGDVVKDKVDYVYATTNGSEADLYNVANVLSDVYGGFGTNFSYKGFDLGLDFTYQIGGKTYDGEYNNLMALGKGGYGIHKDLLNAWTPENAGSDIPRLNVGDSYSATGSDRFLVSASCVTLNNVTFGYTFPKEVLKKLSLTKLRLYFVGDNLYTWSARKGLDPRQSLTGGSSGQVYSFMRTLSAGVQVTF